MVSVNIVRGGDYGDYVRLEETMPNAPKIRVSGSRRDCKAPLITARAQFKEAKSSGSQTYEEEGEDTDYTRRANL